MTDGESALKFPFEVRCAEVLEELKGVTELEVFKADFGSVTSPLDDASRVFNGLAGRYDLPFTERIQEYFFRHNEIAACWRSVRKESKMAGEFRITHVMRSAVENKMYRIWKGENDWERELYRELRIFDDTPSTGSGRMAAFRVTPGTADPEIWFFDTRQGAIRMELDYPGYLEALVITKGVMGWQYLYCQPEFSGLGFASCAGGLREMLDVFPRLFPDHDYTDLRARLQERL